MAFERIDQVLEKYGYRHDALIGIMQDIQRLENYLPLEILQYISQKLEIPLTRIYHITTFYKSFSLTPRGRHTIKVCRGTACHLSGAMQNLEQIERLLHIREGETSEDRTFSLETVNCLGTCAMAPIATVNEQYYGEVTPDKIEKILDIYSKNSRGDGSGPD